MKVTKNSPPLHPVSSGMFARAQAGDRDALERVAEWFYLAAPRERAQQIAARFGLESGELLQSAVVALLCGRGAVEFENTDRLIGYIYRVCLNRALQLVREFRNVSQLADGQLDGMAGPADESPGERAETADVLLTALGRLGEEDRRLVRLLYIQDQSYDEIAVALDIPIGTVKSRLHHARGRLLTLLEGKL